MPVLCLVSGESLEVEINVPAKEYSSIGRNCRFEASFGFLQDKAVELRYLSTSLRPMPTSSALSVWP